jgi:hypothetical protein
MVGDLVGRRAMLRCLLLLAAALCLLEKQVAVGFCPLLAGGDAGELVGNLGEPATEERGRVMDSSRPVAGVVHGVDVEGFCKVAAGPSLAVNELVDDVDKRPQVVAVVESVGSLEELGGDLVCLEWAKGGSPSR